MQESVTQKWLRQNVQTYPAAARVYADADAALSRFPTIRPKTDVYTYDDGRTQLLLCLHGLLPISFRGASYNIPVAVWVTRDYPGQSPISYVVPTSDMLVKAGRFVDPSGKISIEYTHQWERKSEGCNLASLLEAMQAHFSYEPPLYARPQPKPDVQPTSSPLPNYSARPPPALPSSQTPPAANVSSRPALPPKPGSTAPTAYSPYGVSPQITPTASAAATPPPPSLSSRPQPPARPPQLQQQLAQHYPGSPISNPPPRTLSTTSAAPNMPQSAPVASGPLPHSNHWSMPPHPVYSPPPDPRLYVQSPPPPPGSASPSNQGYHPHPLPPPHFGPVPPPQPQALPPPPNLLDEDGVGASLTGPVHAAPLPERPLNPELLRLHEQVRAKITAELASLSQAMAQDAERLRAHQADLLAGEPAINDELGRLEAVRDVCRTVSGRLRGSVDQAEHNVAELKRKGDPEVDELVCSTSIVHNQLINLVAEDNAIEDTIYHLQRALNTGRIDLERFLRMTRAQAEEQFMKRALVEKIQTGLASLAR